MSKQGQIATKSIVVAATVTALSLFVHYQDISYVCQPKDEGGITDASANGFPAVYYLHITDSECDSDKFDGPIKNPSILYDDVGLSVDNVSINLLGLLINITLYFLVVDLLTNTVVLGKTRFKSS